MRDRLVLVEGEYFLLVEGLAVLEICKLSVGQQGNQVRRDLELRVAVFFH